METMEAPVNIVFFHMSTSGKQEPVRPLHIGAIDSWGEQEFECYVWPEQELEEGSDFYTQDGELYRVWHDTPLPCYGLEEALISFVEWLGEVEGTVVLVAHGCFRDQARVLLRNLEEFQISYDQVISGFTDSRLASEKLFPLAPDHSLEGMLEHLGLEGEAVHDAVERAEDSRRVCRGLASHCRMKFLQFIIDPDWSCDVHQQWEWAFET